MPWSWPPATGRPRDLLAGWEAVCDGAGTPTVSGGPTTLGGLIFCGMYVYQQECSARSASRRHGSRRTSPRSPTPGGHLGILGYRRDPGGRGRERRPGGPTRRCRPPPVHPPHGDDPPIPHRARRHRIPGPSLPVGIEDDGRSASSSSTARSRSHPSPTGRSRTRRSPRSRGCSGRSTRPRSGSGSSEASGVPNWRIPTVDRSSATTTSAWRMSYSAVVMRSGCSTSIRGARPPSLRPGRVRPDVRAHRRRRQRRATRFGGRSTARPDSAWWPTPTA